MERLRTYDVHLLAFHVGLTRKWKILQESAGRNNEDEYILRLKYSLCCILFLSFNFAKCLNLCVILKKRVLYMYVHIYFGCIEIYYSAQLFSSRNLCSFIVSKQSLSYYITRECISEELLCRWSLAEQIRNCSRNSGKQDEIERAATQSMPLNYRMTRGEERNLNGIRLRHAPSLRGSPRFEGPRIDSSPVAHFGAN